MKLKIITAIFLLSLSLSACSNKTNEDGVIIPKWQTENSNQAVDNHNQIAKTTYEVGDQIRSLVGKLSGYHQEGGLKSPKEELLTDYNSIFQKSEKLRKTITENSTKEEIKKDFEDNYLPTLDSILGKLKESTAQPENKELFEAANKEFDEYHKKHNNFVETLNKNIFY